MSVRSKAKDSITAVLLLGMLLLSSIVYAQSPIVREAAFKVPPNQTVIIQQGTVAIIVDKIELGDGSKVIIPPDTPFFAFIAKETVAGRNTSIVAVGADGGPGEDGNSGANLGLFLGDAALYRLEVITTGGEGGKGVQGSKGRRGGDAKCSSRDATNGGRGGVGGSGGHGGDGGNIYVFLSERSRPLGLSLRSDGGLAGAGGAGGEGGDGGAGKARCGPWPYWKKGAGSKGHVGADGPPGSDGKWGDFNMAFLDAFDSILIKSKLNEIVLDLDSRGLGEAAELMRRFL